MATYSARHNSQGVIILPEVERSNIAKESQAIYRIPLDSFYVWDSGARLPNTSASDDLGFYQGTFATSSPLVRTYDVKTLTTTLYARAVLWLPPEYEAAATVKLQFNAGMVTTVASSACTIDAQMFETDLAGGIGSDLVTTNAIDINSLTFASKTFNVTSTTLSPGDILDLRVAIAVTDSATGTAVIGAFGSAALLLDIRG